MNSPIPLIIPLPLILANQWALLDSCLISSSFLTHILLFAASLWPSPNRAIRQAEFALAAAVLSSLLRCCMMRFLSLPAPSLSYGSQPCCCQRFKEKVQVFAPFLELAYYQTDKLAITLRSSYKAAYLPRLSPMVLSNKIKQWSSILSWQLGDKATILWQGWCNQIMNFLLDSSTPLPHIIRT